MKKYFAVTFEYCDSIYCSKIAHAETAEAVKAHYSKYEWVDIREAEEHEIETARRKGMPIVEIETPVTEQREPKEGNRHKTICNDFKYAKIEPEQMKDLQLAQIDFEARPADDGKIIVKYNAGDKEKVEKLLTAPPSSGLKLK